MGLYVEFIAYPPDSHCYKLLLDYAHKSNPNWKELKDEKAIEKYLDSLLPIITDEQDENYGPKGLDNIYNLYEDILLDCEHDCSNVIASIRTRPNLNGQMEKQWRNKYKRLPYYVINEDDHPRGDFNSIPFQITADEVLIMKRDKWPNGCKGFFWGMQDLTTDEQYDLITEIIKALIDKNIILYVNSY